jgi:hypothetical protein
MWPFHRFCPRGVTGILLLSVFLTGTVPGEGYAQSVTIARWKNNATGAYSIIMDDYGFFYQGLAVNGHVPLAARGLRVSFAIVAGACDEQDWKKAREMFAYGHRFASHSWDHTQPYDWDPDDFPLQFDQSKAEIEQQIPGAKAIFWACPYNRSRTDQIEYLRTAGYIGARAGGNGINTSLPDPFYCRYETFQDSVGLPGLNAFVNEAISLSGWALRETHGVEDTSYHPIPQTTWEAHLDYCKSKVDDGSLWMAPVQEVIQYIVERDSYTASIETIDSETLAVTFMGPALDTYYFDQPLTLVVELPPRFTVETIIQEGSQLPYVQLGTTTIRFDAYPFEDSIIISAMDPSLVPPAEPTLLRVE